MATTNIPNGASNTFINKFIVNLHDLIKVKEKQMACLNNEGKKDTAEYKQIPFKLKYYRQWYNTLIEISDWPSGDSVNLTDWLSVIKDKYKLQDSLITKMKEVNEHGHIIELFELKTKYSITQPSAETLNSYQPSNCQKLNMSDTESNPVQTIQIINNTQVETKLPIATVSPSVNMAVGSTVQQSVNIPVEAVPKKLALEGDRPDDSDPRGQKIYDMRLIHGFGEKNAIEYVDAGCTLEILLADWEKFSAHPDSYGGIIDKDCISLPNGVDETKLTQTKLFALKEEILRERLAKVSTWLPKLHHDQLVGVKYFKDTAQKIPREEIDKIQKYCQIVSKSLNPGFELMCCGSYRRGRARSGDVDCLMTHIDLKTPEDILKYESENGSIIQAMVTLLKKLGFVTDYFTIGETKFMGICKLPSNSKGTYTTYRHMDIRFVPYNSKGTAMLYFTGSFEYNKQMRYKANDKGYMLSEYGIFKYTKDKTGKKVKGEQVNIPFYTEESVCEWLGMPYLAPNERDI